MRVRLTLRPLTLPLRVTLNYAYYLSTAVYRWIEASSPDYAAFLHERGFPLDGTLRRFKHFTFSRLMPRQSRVDTRSACLVVQSPKIEWHLSMPVEQSLQHLVAGMFEHREFFIGNENSRLAIEQVETLPDPDWQRRMTFTMLSPTTISTMREHSGKLQPYYFRPDDEQVPEALRRNILNKYHSLHGALPDDTTFICTLDQTYIRNRQTQGKRITQKITIKEGRTDASDIIGFTCPVTIEGNPALLALAYESGLGEKNSLGFGMLQTYSSNTSGAR